MATAERAGAALGRLRAQRLGSRGADRLALAILGGVALVAGAWIMHEGRGLTFFYDEWNWLLEQPDGLTGLLAPHEGHLAFLPRLAFTLLLSVAGVEPYWAFRLLAVAVHVLCAGLLFALVRRRLGPGPALAAATVLLALGSAWQVVLWPLEIAYTFAVAAGLGALLALDARSRRGDAAAAALVLVALASSGLGIAIAAGVLAELVLSPPWRRRVWVALAPLAVWATWYAVQSPESAAKVGNIDAVPVYVGNAAAGAVGAVTGLGAEFGRVLLVAGAIVVIMRLLAPAALPARLVGVLTMGIAYWALLGLARADLDEPAASRYLYFGAVIVLLAGALTVRRIPPAPRVWALLALAVLGAVVSNLGQLRAGANSLRGVTNDLRPALAAVELAGDAVPPATQPEPNAAPQVRAGLYREFVADSGSPIGGAAAVLDGGPQSAVAVDAALARVLGVAVVPEDGPIGARPPRVLAAVEGRARTEGSCLRYTPAGTGAALDLTLDAGSSVVLRDVAESAQLRLRRMSDAFSADPIGTVEPGAEVAIQTPRDAIARPWVLRISPGGALRACTGSRR